MATLIIFLVIIVFVFAGAKANHAKRVALWTKAANELGIAPPAAKGFLTYAAGLNGVVDGHPVLVRHITGKNTNYVRYEVRYPDVGVDISLRAQRGVSGFMASSKLLSRIALGGEDVITDDGHFDDNVIATGANDAAVRAFLTPARRASVVRLLETYRNAKVDSNSIEAHVAGAPPSADNIVGHVRRLTSAAAVVSGSDQQFNTAMASIEGGDLGQGLRQLDAIQGPAAVEARITTAAILAAGAGTAFEVDTAASAIDDAIPDATALHEASRELQLNSPPPPPPAPPPAPDDAPIADESAQDELLATLFGQSTLDARKTFETEVQGTTIEWTGVVRRARSFANDLDFGPGPGMKAVIGVGSVDMGTYGEVEIDAIVALPDGVDLSPGQTVTFAGTAHKIDGFTRNLFVTNGELRG